MKSHELYLYDEIVSEKYPGYDGELVGFTPNDLSDVLHGAESGDTVNLFVNSPGGSVFAAVAMTSEIKRARSKGITVDAYVDGIAASAASFLIMACDTVHMYNGSMLMVHKPWNFCIGNANDFLKAAEELETIENSTCMPIYRDKLRGDEEELRALLANETWLSAKQSAEIFDIVLIDESKDVKSVMTDSVIAKFHYHNTPDDLIVRNTTQAIHDPEPEENEAEAIEPETEPEPAVDLSQWEERISNLGGKR